MPDLTDDEYDALHDMDGRTEEATTEYAVVYFKRGKPVAEGPYPKHVAEKKAADKRGVVAERTVTTDFGLWAPSGD